MRFMAPISRTVDRRSIYVEARIAFAMARAMRNPAGASAERVEARKIRIMRYAVTLGMHRAGARP